MTQDPVFMTSCPRSNPLERCPSQTSTLSNNNDICRICHCEGEDDAPLIAPCYCAGSLRYVHQACLQQWIKSSDIRSCELCKFQFVMQSKLKPINKWESLEMNGVERRKLFCSVTFHAVALTCVVWSLYVLVDRTVEEIHRGLLEWPFWTKLIVVAIGFAGGAVFMYIQCKAYLHLCRRWRAFNRVIYVQNAPEKAALPPSTQVMQPAKLVRQDSSFVSETCCGVGGPDGPRPPCAPDPTVLDMGPVFVHKKDPIPILQRSKVDCEIDCSKVESGLLQKLPTSSNVLLGDTKVIVATSSGTNYFTEAENLSRALSLIDKLPTNEEYIFDEGRLLAVVDDVVSDGGHEERVRLLDLVPGMENDHDRMNKSGGFQLLPSSRQTSHNAGNKSSRRNSGRQTNSNSSEEDSFESVSANLLQNHRPPNGSELAMIHPASTRPWSSWSATPTWPEKPQGVDGNPKSSQGSLTSLPVAATPTDNSK